MIVKTFTGYSNIVGVAAQEAAQAAQAYLTELEAQYQGALDVETHVSHSMQPTPDMTDAYYEHVTTLVVNTYGAPNVGSRYTATEADLLYARQLVG
jgi:hypothetical protein